VRHRRLHIFGASGSGTTSLATVPSLRHGHVHLDADDFYWLPTEPPFQTVRPREERPALSGQ
jgi:adenylate kinase family enzyme